MEFTEQIHAPLRMNLFHIEQFVICPGPWGKKQLMCDHFIFLFLFYNIWLSGTKLKWLKL